MMSSNNSVDLLEDGAFAANKNSWNRYYQNSVVQPLLTGKKRGRLLRLTLPSESAYVHFLHTLLLLDIISYLVCQTE